MKISFRHLLKLRCASQDSLPKNTMESVVSSVMDFIQIALSGGGDQQRYPHDDFARYLDSVQKEEEGRRLQLWHELQELELERSKNSQHDMDDVPAACGMSRK